MIKIMNVCNDYNYLGYIIGHFPDAIAYLKGSENFPNINGKTEFYQTNCGVLVLTMVENLPSISNFFGYHIHTGSDCTGTNETPFSNAGGHFNPNNATHPNHAGDLPPLLYCDGNTYQIVLTDKFTVKEILNKTVIIHADVDDFKTDPDGASGERIACGKILCRR